MKVRIGLGTSTGGDASDLRTLIDDVEGLGFDSIWLPEVLTAPTLDPLGALSFAAAYHPSVKLGTTMLLPGRNLIRLAKELATLDRLSNGRLLVTFVSGLPRPPELGAVGVEKNLRGRWMDEALPVLRRLWAGESVSYHGVAGDFDDVTLAVRPTQEPLEIWTGGTVPSALRRTGQLADGWLPSACTPEEAAAGKRVVEEHAEAAGREISPEHFGVSLAYSNDPLEPSVARLLKADRPGVDPADVVPRGIDGLRRLIERFLTEGFSKFVVRPLAPPATWRQELEALADGLLDLQT
jgi:probable F420-dependent oxidoreductase